VITAGTVTHEVFGQAVGISRPKVTELVSSGVLREDGTAAEWLLAYCLRLREQAAGRLGQTADGLDLVQERAALAREQRIGWEIKNAVARETYAPIEMLADVLANASQAIVDRLDQLPGDLRRHCPDLPPEAIAVVMRALAAARNEWVRKTESLVVERLEAELQLAELEDEGPDGGEGA
jgi:phage terminase Nu1 subunit (DNA packaging protein)